MKSTITLPEALHNLFPHVSIDVIVKWGLISDEEWTLILKVRDMFYATPMLPTIFHYRAWEIETKIYIIFGLFEEVFSMLPGRLKGVAEGVL